MSGIFGAGRTSSKDQCCLRVILYKNRSAATAIWIELGTSEDDEAAIGLYESAGFINREGGPDGPVMFVYEREL